MKYFIILLIMLLPAGPLLAQEFENINPERMKVHDKDISQLSPLEILEDSLVFMVDSMYFSSLDESRIDGSYEFIRLFKKFLHTPGSFSAPLTKLREKITIIEAPDQRFRLYNWEVVRSGYERRYYGAIQSSDGESMPLVDISDQIIRGAEDSTFSNSRWFGCLYYNIQMKDIGNQRMYFLLGWNGNSLNSDRKLVEAMRLGNKQVAFGAPVFNLIDRGKRRSTKRMIIEYQKGAKLSLNLDAETGNIIFDHCESQIGDPAKKYTYIPDGTYDGLRWEKDQWVMDENMIRITNLKDGEAPVDKAIIR